MRGEGPLKATPEACYVPDHQSWLWGRGGSQLFLIQLGQGKPHSGPPHSVLGGTGEAPPTGNGHVCILSLFPPDQVLASPCKQLICVLERNQDVDIGSWDRDTAQKRGIPSLVPKHGLPRAWHPAPAHNPTPLALWPRDVIAPLMCVGMAIGHRALRVPGRGLRAPQIWWEEPSI